MKILRRLKKEERENIEEQFEKWFALSVRL